MRNIVNISLPETLRKEVDIAVRKGNYASTSEFFRDLLRMWKEKQLVRDIAISEREFAAGKGKRLKSLKELR